MYSTCLVHKAMNCAAPVPHYERDDGVVVGSDLSTADQRDDRPTWPQLPIQLVLLFPLFVLVLILSFSLYFALVLVLVPAFALALALLPFTFLPFLLVFAPALSLLACAFVLSSFMLRPLCIFHIVAGLLKLAWPVIALHYTCAFRIW